MDQNPLDIGKSWTLITVTAELRESLFYRAHLTPLYRLPQKQPETTYNVKDKSRRSGGHCTTLPSAFAPKGRWWVATGAAMMYASSRNPWKPTSLRAPSPRRGEGILQTGKDGLRWSVINGSVTETATLSPVHGALFTGCSPRSRATGQPL